MNLIDQFSDSSEPFPVELAKIYNLLGYIDKYTALEIVEAYFQEGTDFEIDGANGFLSVECLQELMMIARTPQGKAARLYFLECERIAKSVTGNIPQVSAPPEELPIVLPTEEQLHAMRTRKSEKLELAALPVSQKKIPKFRRAVDIARDRAAKAKAKAEAEVIDC